MPFHVRISHFDPSRRRRDTLALDKDEEWIEQHVVRPRAEGRATFIDGRVVSWDDVDELRVTWTEPASHDLITQIATRRRQAGVFASIPDAWYVAYEGKDVTDRFISG